MDRRDINASCPPPLYYHHQRTDRPKADARVIEHHSPPEVQFGNDQLNHDASDALSSHFSSIKDHTSVTAVSKDKPKEENRGAFPILTTLIKEILNLDSNTLDFVGEEVSAIDARDAATQTTTGASQVPDVFPHHEHSDKHPIKVSTKHGRFNRECCKTYCQGIERNMNQEVRLVAKSHGLTKVSNRNTSRLQPKKNRVHAENTRKQVEESFYKAPTGRAKLVIHIPQSTHQ